MSKGSKPSERGLLKASLRALFIRRDRAEREIAAIDSETGPLIRKLSSIDGLITPMRVEQARREVMGDMEKDAA